MHVDTTFNLGEIYLTLITYRNLSLISRNSNQNPIFLGPCMVHLEKDTASYFAFASYFKKFELENYLKNLNKIKVIGTDEDGAL